MKNTNHEINLIQVTVSTQMVLNIMPCSSYIGVNFLVIALIISLGVKRIDSESSAAFHQGQDGVDVLVGVSNHKMTVVGSFECPGLHERAEKSTAMAISYFLVCGHPNRNWDYTGPTSPTKNEAKDLWTVLSLCNINLARPMEWTNVLHLTNTCHSAPNQKKTQTSNWIHCQGAHMGMVFLAGMCDCSFLPRIAWPIIKWRPYGLLTYCRKYQTKRSLQNKEFQFKDFYHQGTHSQFPVASLSQSFAGEVHEAAMPMDYHAGEGQVCTSY